jgi:hypothetical protein
MCKGIIVRKPLFVVGIQTQIQSPIHINTGMNVARDKPPSTMYISELSCMREVNVASLRSNN